MNQPKFSPASIATAMLAGVWCALVAGRLLAADGQDVQELLHLVRPDAGVCITIEPTVEGAASPALTEQFLRWSPVQRWRTGESFTQFRRDLAALERRVGRPAGEFFRGLFGGGAVLAAYPQPEGEPVTVLLLRASDAELMQTAVDVWNEAERARTEPVSADGVTYTRRTARKPPHQSSRNAAETAGEDGEQAEVVQFYLHEGRLLALSDDEAAIRDVARRLAGTETSALATSPRYRRAIDALRHKHRVAVYFNPRAWDGSVKLPASPDPFERELIAAWTRAESVTIGVSTEHALIFEAVALFALNASPTETGKTDADEPGPLDVFGRVPASAVVAAGGRWNAAGWGAYLTERIPEKDRAEWDNLRRIARGFLLGRDVFDDVLPALGPTWCGYVAVRADAEADELPLEAVLAIDLRPDESDAAPGASVRSALENVLTNAFSIAAALAPDGGRLREWQPEDQAEQAADVTIRHIEGFELWQPAFAVTADRLVLATRPAAIASHLAHESRKAGQQDNMPGATGRWLGASSDQAVLLNLAGWRRLITERRQELAEHAAEASALSVDEAGRRIDRMLELMELFDAVFATISAEPGRLRIVIGGTAK